MSAAWAIRDAGLDRVRGLAAFLALVLRPGDAVALTGGLGTGKTTFARSLIRAVLEDEAHDIPSPTFALVQTYDEGRLPITHIDCYRLGDPGEVREIGLDDALRSGAALIEWADRIGEALPADRLEIAFADGARDDTRNLTLTGHGEWKFRIERLEAMTAFCAGTAWAGATPRYLQGDASTRAYARLARPGETAVLMDSPPQPDGPPVKDGKPYSKLVHLAENVKPFVAVAGALNEAGLSMPQVFAHDLEQGFLIIEDLGDRVVAAEPGDDPALEEIYTAAVDALIELARHPPPEKLPLPDGSEHVLPPFGPDVFATEASLLLDWFYPAATGAEPPGDAREDFLAALGVLHAIVDGREQGWVLRDFHSPNLMWLADRTGLKRAGVIDFQDALRGHAAYDLVSLLQDARRDIPEALEGRLFAHYCQARSGRDSGFDADAFGAAYAAFGAQRNSKILGIFARLAKRDGKHGYLAHIPRVSAYLERDLAHPALADLRQWFETHLPRDVRARPLLT